MGREVRERLRRGMARGLGRGERKGDALTEGREKETL